MKKVIALFLAVMMIFGALSISSSAMDLEAVKKDEDIKSNQVILIFDLNGGTIKGGVRVYTPKYYDAQTNTWVDGSFNYVENYLENMYYMIPESDDAQIPSKTVRLPGVNPPSGYVFNGWFCVETNHTYPGNRMFTIPDYTGDSLLHFTAAYGLETPEEDEMAGVFNILVKVFGTIIGLLFLSDREEGAVEAGMQLMSDLLGSLFA